MIIFWWTDIVHVLSYWCVWIRLWSALGLIYQYELWVGFRIFFRMLHIRFSFSLESTKMRHGSITIWYFKTFTHCRGYMRVVYFSVSYCLQGYSSKEFRRENGYVLDLTTVKSSMNECRRGLLVYSWRGCIECSRAKYVLLCKNVQQNLTTFRFVHMLYCNARYVLQSIKTTLIYWS